MIFDSVGSSKGQWVVLERDELNLDSRSGGD